ncbi:Uncharacterized membrane protein YesL [Fictibacillus solisalsi]|uniref:Uncharacterized membrane protein YesL n=1 Tax=Fictibacillus solisalsi TaxID=459525 RepID=A0A1G9YDI6_9BACL|nr:DUF624 domain-containing protein [Fictibacillus solisalsi]SDN07222.1 Uncharacterized membrane protein YesL [Fictibacillus solisalsi]
MDGTAFGGFYMACVWFARFAFSSVLWLLFSLAGLIIGGVFPATAALFAVERSWIRKEESPSLIRQFWREYRTQFVKANLLGYFMVLFGLLLWVNVKLVFPVDYFLVGGLKVLLLGLFFLYVIVMLYLFPVLAHFKGGLMDCVKNALFVGLSSPLMTVLSGLSILVVTYICYVIPGLSVFFYLSGAGFLSMWFSHCAFLRLEGKAKAGGLNG